MFNSFVIEGTVTHVGEAIAASGAVRQKIQLCFDDSFYDKKNHKKVERRAEIYLRRYIKKDNEVFIQPGDYIIATGNFSVIKNHENEENFLCFLVKDFVLV